MALPRRLTYSIFEAAARWFCSNGDIIDWSLSGQIEICAVIPLASSNGRDISGLMIIPAEEVAQLFRRDGFGQREARVRRCRPKGGNCGWDRITDPADGITVTAFDIIITTDEIERFEKEFDLAPKATNYRGGSARWDWDEFYTALIRRIHVGGLPERQSDLVEEMTGWFERRSDTGETPDPSTIRKKIAAVWREINAA